MSYSSMFRAARINTPKSDRDFANKFKPMASMYKQRLGSTIISEKEPTDEPVDEEINVTYKQK